MIVLNWFMLLLVALTATGLIFSRDWRWSLGFLALQYLGVFWMIQLHWPISMSAVKLVTGWMACAILGIASLNSRAESTGDKIWTQGRLFHAFAGALIWVVAFAISPRVIAWLGLSQPIAYSSLLLIGLGLLHLGITSDPLKVILGLLTVFSGFEILYTTVETSALVTALLSIINLGLALSGAYFVIGSQGKFS